MSKFSPVFHAGLYPEAWNRVLGVLSKEEKPLRKCILPGCNNTHRHNGGYCSSEHCRAHKEMQKERKKR